MHDPHPQILITTQPASPHLEAFTAKLLVPAGEGTALAGRARVCLVNTDAAARSGQPVSELLASGTLSDYASLFEHATPGTFTPALMTQLGEDIVATRNFLIVECLQVLPEFRGRGLGKLLLEHCLDVLGCDSRVAALVASPLQLEHWYPRGTVDPWIEAMGLNQLPGRPAAAYARLTRYYERQGFRRVPGTHLLVRDLVPIGGARLDASRAGARASA